jgi:hypothetical protein
MKGAQYNSLPRMAREQADRMFCRSRNRPAPGDRYWYRYRIEEPEADYVGPLPITTLIGREKIRFNSTY